MARKDLSPEQIEMVRREFVSLLQRKGFKRICELQSGRSYWKHRRTDRTLMLYRDDAGQLRTLKL